jgi:hypothetical protein
MRENVVTGGGSTFCGENEDEGRSSIHYARCTRFAWVDKLTHRATDLWVRIIDRNLLGKTGVMSAALPRLVCMLTAKNDAHPVVTPLMGPYE